jgi:hypothetical protein
LILPAFPFFTRFALFPVLLHRWLVQSELALPLLTSVSIVAIVWNKIAFFCTLCPFVDRREYLPYHPTSASLCLTQSRVINHSARTLIKVHQPQKSIKSTNTKCLPHEPSSPSFPSPSPPPLPTPPLDPRYRSTYPPQLPWSAHLFLHHPSAPQPATPVSTSVATRRSSNQALRTRTTRRARAS